MCALRGSCHEREKYTTSRLIEVESSTEHGLRLLRCGIGPDRCSPPGRVRARARQMRGAGTAFQAAVALGDVALNQGDYPAAVGERRSLRGMA
jgi:hypothetical protein